VLTYPRTDSRALPEDYLGTVKQTLSMLAHTPYGPFANQILQADWVRPNKRIFNNAKVSDHFAIIPTSLQPKHLNDLETRLYDLVTKRFLAVFFPAAEFLVTTRITRVLEEPFKTEGKVLVNPGWLAVYGRKSQTEEPAANLTRVQPGETVQTTKVEVIANQTKPPARFTEATLLSAMEGAGKLVEDEDLREAMLAKGLGTPSTRAAIIDGLIYEKYLLRQGRDLVPTPKAFSLITLLRGLELPELVSPELTGDWEFKLRQIEHGQLSRTDFMGGIADMTRHIVARAKGHESDTVPGDFGALQAPCPKCGGEIKENYKKFQCQRCDFFLWRILAGRQIEPAEAEQLVTQRQVGPLQGFRSRLGKPFAGLLRLSEDFKVEFDFGQDRNQAGEAVAPVDFTGQEPLGKCPKCGARVFENGMTYACEKAAGPERTCDFRSGKIILQQPIERAQMTKLLATGKTDLLQQFISKKGRPFGAYLAVGKDGKVGFEFEERPARKTVKAKEPPAKLDFTGQEPVGACPKCGKRIFESETHYVCEMGQAPGKACKFRSGKVILHQPIDRAQMAKLLSTGRSDLLTQFLSKHGRHFAACLVLEDGKVSFDFPPRQAAEPPKAPPALPSS
jgi:DNA topoisomerase-3